VGASWRGSAPPNHPAKGRGAFGNRDLVAQSLVESLRGLRCHFSGIINSRHGANELLSGTGNRLTKVDLSSF